MNQSTMHFRKWEDVIQELFFSKFDTQSQIQHPSGKAPTIIFIGPTGSGKTTLINSLIGHSFLPEGTDHTTFVPIILYNGKKSLIKALDSNGQAVPGIPEPAVPYNDIPQTIPFSDKEVIKTLNREESFEDIQKFRQIFWNPACKKAKEGKCNYIEIHLPLPWLPENVRIIDIPGYEGWYPEKSSKLHNLVLNWIKTADHAVFIMEKTKVLLGKSFKFLTLPNQQNNVTLLINQMDSFNPSQIHNIKKNEQAFDVFRENIKNRLIEENIPMERISIYLGAARMERRCKPWLEKQIISEMGGWFKNFKNIIDNISSDYEKRHIREEKERNEKFHKLEKEIKQTIKDAYTQAENVYLSHSAIEDVKKSVCSAIENVDVGFTRLFSKEKLAQKYQKEIIKNVQKPLKVNFEKAMDTYGNHIQKNLKDSLKQFFKEMNRQGDFIDQSRLADQITQSLGGVSGEVAGSLTVLLGGIVMSIVGSLLIVETTQILFIVISSTINPVMLTVTIVGALTTLVVGGRLFSIKTRVSKKIKEAVVPKFDKDKMTIIWTESTKNLNNTAFEAIWKGKDTKNLPLYINGKRFEGLETLIRKN